MVVVWDRVTVDRMGVIALRTRTLTDDALPGHASSHGQLTPHLGSSSFTPEGDNHSGNRPRAIPTRLTESGDAKPYACSTYNIQTGFSTKCIERVIMYSCAVRMFLLPCFDFPNVELNSN